MKNYKYVPDEEKKEERKGVYIFFFLNLLKSAKSLVIAEKVLIARIEKKFKSHSNLQLPYKSGIYFQIFLHIIYICSVYILTLRGRERERERAREGENGRRRDRESCNSVSEEEGFQADRARSSGRADQEPFRFPNRSRRRQTHPLLRPVLSLSLSIYSFAFLTINLKKEKKKKKNSSSSSSVVVCIVF